MTSLQILDGDDKIETDDGRKVKACKRVSFKTLPPHLIVHLKRCALAPHFSTSIAFAMLTPPHTQIRV